MTQSSGVGFRPIKGLCDCAYGVLALSEAKREHSFWRNLSPERLPQVKREVTGEKNPLSVGFSGVFS